jgi:glycosyltransferase involved in cell wall biosynthesis
MKRVLLCAYQCGEAMGSVSQIGWEWYSRMAKETKLTLVTHIRNKASLTKSGAPIGDSEIIYIDTEWFASPLYKLAQKLLPGKEHAIFMLSSLDYFLYDQIALKVLKEKMSQGVSWDLIHIVTPVSTFTPSCLHKLQIPLIIGPLNSGLTTPKGFSEIMKAEASWLYPTRYLGRFLDFLLNSSKNTKTILTATKATLSSLPAKVHSRCIKMIENGVDLNRFSATSWPNSPSLTNPLKILFVGRVIPVKGLPMLLSAISKVKEKLPVELTVIGDGSELNYCKEKAKELNISKEVKFLGALPLDKVAEHMQNAHVFCLPSVRESGGAVLLEAMASARPVVAIDFGGPSEIVDKEVGILIPAKNTEFVISHLITTFIDIFENPKKWRLLGENGRKQAETKYTWSVKIQTALEIYQQNLA